MTFQINIKHDLKKIERLYGQEARPAIRRAANRANNRAANKVASVATKEIAADTGISPQRKVREHIHINGSNVNTLTATVTAQKKAFNLIEFVDKRNRNPQAFRVKAGMKSNRQFKHGGVAAKAWRQRKTYPGTFIGRGKDSGKMLVFVRTSKARKPIKAVVGPSIPRTFIQRRVTQVMLREGEKTWRVNFERDVDYFLNRRR